MMWSMLLLIILTLAAGFLGWMFFLWAVKSGQYDDIEGPKYRMLDDEDEPGGKNKRTSGSSPDNSGNKQT